MSGFFRKGAERAALEAPVRLTGCASCGLASGCLHPRMEPSGRGSRRILFVAEAPGADEDRLGTQLVGEAGQLLRRTLSELGVDLDRDCRKTNSVRCRPPGNREPEPQEKAACRKHVFEEIQRSRPSVIIPLGGHGLWSLLEGRWRRDGALGITRWRGLTIPDHSLGGWLCPTFHPSYVLRNRDWNPATEVIWRRDLHRAVHMDEVPLPARPQPDIRTLGLGQIGPFLLDLWKRAQQDPVTMAFDYETTGLKPYREEQRIVCCAVAESPDRAAAWSWDDMSKQDLALYREVMLSPLVRKIAGNMKFEQVWTRAKCGHDVRGWLWDTVIAAKAQDYRLGNASVKFQAYAKLGVLGYESSVEGHIKAPGPNALNRMLEAPRHEVLEYCAWDSAMEYGIALRQMEEVGRA